MKTTFLFVLLCSLLAAGTAQAQVIKHSYRFFNNFSTTSIECGPDLTPVPAEGSCNAAATPGGFVTDNLPQCGIGRTVYHTNMHWGLSYPNTSNTITHTYTIHIYVKTTDFGSRSWARIIDFSNGALDEGIYYKTSGVDDRRCLDFYPSGIVGDCPFFNASTYYLLTFTRNGATGIIDVYVNNKKFVSYNDAAGTYTGKPGTPITIYRDDRSVACESGAANIAFLSFTNQYSSQSVVNAVYDDICSIANSDNSADFSLSPNPVCGTGQDVVVRYTGDLVPPATGYTFTWDWDGGTVKSGSGMGPYTVTWPTAGTKNVRLTITRAACGGAINSSTRTHSLQVTGSPSSVIHKTICSGQQFEGYAATGTYVDRFTTASGCDSTRTLHLTVTARVTTTIDKTICQGQSYEGYSASGTYTDTYPSAGGCDSVRTLNLTVVSTLTSAVRETICAGARYTLPSGRQVGAGVYTETLRSAAGCDSVVTYTVREQAVQRSNLRPVVCAGTPYKLPSGRSVDQPGTYSDTLRYTTGCDSAIATVTLTVQSPARQTADAAVCAGQRYTLPSGRVVDAAGTYRDTLRYTTGCDSVLTTVRLTIHPVTDRTVTAAICSGQSYTLPSGRVVTVAGQYREVFTAQTGCDSIITTVLSVSDAVRRTEQAAICAGQRYTLPGGRTVSTAGLYEDRFRTAGGCDSIVVTLLTVHPAVRTQQSVFICAGALFTLPSGRKAGAGTYLDTLRAATGCDSIITTTVQERTVSRVAEQATVCAGSSYQLPSGRWVSAAGTYSDTLRYPGGCDSVIATIGLQVQAVRREAVPVSLCQGQVYALPSGRVVSVSGTYLDTLRYTSGCDSLLTTVTLTVTPRNAFGVTPSAPQICPGERVTLQASGGDRYRWLPAAGITDETSPVQQVQPAATTTYFVVMDNRACGLKDTVSVTVTVNPLPRVQVAKSNDVNCTLAQAQLEASGGVTYRWSPATGLSTVQGARVMATPAATTVYRVQTTSAAGCVAEASVEVVVAAGPAAFSLPSGFSPNGDGLNDCFGVGAWGAVSRLQFRIYNRWGNLVFQTTDPAQCWDGTYKGQKLPGEVFIYQVSATTHCGPVTRKGTVLILR